MTNPKLPGHRRSTATMASLGQKTRKNTEGDKLTGGNCVTLGRMCVSTVGVVQSKKHCRLDGGIPSSTHCPPMSPPSLASSSTLPPHGPRLCSRTPPTTIRRAPNRSRQTKEETEPAAAAGESNQPNPPALCASSSSVLLCKNPNSCRWGDWSAEEEDRKRRGLYSSCGRRKAGQEEQRGAI